ncbi:hypothetical protein TCAL_08567 [Tigriopus californicus]|uniref:Bromo domain-containing protein n=1 Tax=Tigriopus californicus TaxID=6832 RepID=A0A553PDS3_TIGCA|nr:bromodomain and WD repeat-containing protein 3-like [Tigriopus californicus]TRY75830.1 hypothetical protein TCAL_08567 [Tigriopus californicus]|eukprot:TCALIF_08567-PA protein Name:"Similar to Brwd1 Bromodomain and WD repeat-containing protein 1 (Mus musculus)" AED:0.00 eAED:0.00 QI:138/1/1/1/1/1/2/177/2074
MTDSGPRPPVITGSSMMVPDHFKSDFLFLLTRYLEQEPDLAGVGHNLRALITQQGLLQPRYDWQGRSHARTFDEVERENQNISGQLLLDLAYQFCAQHNTGPQLGMRARTLLGRMSDPPAPQPLHPMRRLGLGQLGLKGAGPSSRGWHHHLCGHLKHLRRTLGHLARVYCLLFDRSGQYVFTGADDLLVKCWRVTDGNLIHTFRGASSEITDMAISHDNRLLAAGSVDKIIRVWCLNSAAPVAVLTKHTGMITAINFCPYTEDGHYYLASTSGDGTVSFWKYGYNEHDTAEFDPVPTRYHEKIRPGQAGMICASFSPGGIFFCVGSADHHVRVYQMNGLDGPVRILEEEAHNDVVESIQWCNQPDLRFLSGSKDGTARIWSFKSQRWVSILLDMTDGESFLNRPPPPKPSNRPPKKNPSHASSSRNRAGGGTRSRENRTVRVAEDVADAEEGTSAGGGSGPDNERRVTMVAWTLDDVTVVTAVSNKTLKLWDSRTGRLKATLKGHEGEIFVLEPHPIMCNLMLSAAHDGQIIVWDLDEERALFRHRNKVDDQNVVAEVFDAKWSPDSLTIAATDSYGHLLFIGHGSSEKYDRLPLELFFHTDYRPLLRDSFHHVVDEQTQVPPHLLPAPFLVDSEGNPYEAHIQKFVPGRERMSEREAHLPGGPEPSFNVRPEQAAPPPAPPTPVVAAPSSAPVSVPGAEGVVAVDPVPGPSRAQTGPELRNEDSNGSTLSSGGPVVSGRVILKKGQGASQKDICEHMSKTQTCSIIESSRFLIEVNKVASDGHEASSKSHPFTSKSKKPKSTAAANARRHEDEDDGEDTEADPEPNEGEEGHETSDCSMDESDFTSAESTTEEETDHSDWGSDQDEQHQQSADGPDGPGRSGSKSKRKQRTSSIGSRTPTPRKKVIKSSEKTKKKRTAAQRCRENMLKHPSDISDAYMPSQWLSESIPKKSPYFPQMNDVLMYFKQGHKKYIDLVKTRKTYPINMREERDWMARKTIGDVCLVRVAGIKFEIRPPRLCVLNLTILNQHNLRANGESFSIKYHDMNDVVDFLVLHDIFKNSKGKHWKNGDRIRCQIDDCWWKGTVQKVEYHDVNKRSPFLSIYCHWDNGEKEFLSPWDIEALDADTALVPDGTMVTPEQLKSCLYHPTVDEWNSMGIEGESKRISDALEAVMSLAISEPFNYPVDLTAYPEYMLDVEYPMDLNLIKTRIDNKFYRRIDAIEYDIKYVASNAASFNRPRSDIVRNAKIITKLILEIIHDPTKSQDDVSSIYHRLVENFVWSENEDYEPDLGNPRTSGHSNGQDDAHTANSDDSNESSDDDDDDDDDDDEEEEEEDGSDDPGEGPSSSGRSLRKKKKKKKINQSPPATLNPKKWKHDCNELLSDMAAHPLSVPFREPVSELEFPDYFKHITTPMDISTVRESLLIGEFDSPHEFRRDVHLIFRNSREYNTDPKAKILSMTLKLEAWFEQRINPIIAEWKRTTRRLAMSKSKSKNKSSKADAKGKGKGKGKGQSNNIKKSKPKKPVPVLSEDDNDHEDGQSESEEDMEEASPTSSPVKRPRSQGPRPMRTANPAANNSHPVRETLSEGEEPGNRRASSRVHKTPVRYREDFDLDDEHEHPENGERPKRQRKPRRSDGFAYSDEDEDDAPLSRKAVKKRKLAQDSEEGERSPQESTTPKRNPKRTSPGSSSSKKGRVNESSEDEDDDVPLARKLGARMRHEGGPMDDSERKARIVQRLAKEPSEDEEEVRPQKLSLRNARKQAAQTSNPQGRNSRAARRKVESYLEDEEDEEDDDLPLQRPQRKPAPQNGRSARGGSKLRKRHDSDEEEPDLTEDEEEESEEEESEDEMPLKRQKTAPTPSSAPPPMNGRRTQRAAALNTMKKFAHLGDDSEDIDSDDQPLTRKPPKKKKAEPAKRSPKKRKPARDDFVDDGSSEDEDEESEPSSSEPDFLESDYEDEVRPKRGHGGRSKPQPQPKLNASRRAAQAIDSESEHTSARRPSRLTNRNGLSAKASSTGARASAAAKRTYLEESEDGDSEQENRRPRRAAAAKKVRMNDSEYSEEDFEEGQQVRKPNTRII